MTNIIVSSLTGGHHDAITALALSERNLASGSGDCTICLWSPLQSRSPVNKISVESSCTSLKFAQNKPDLIYAAHGGNICCFDFRNVSAPIFNVKVSDEEVNSIDLMESEARLASGDDTGSIQIVSSDSGQLLRTLKKHDNICSSVLFRPNRTWQVISGGLDSRLVVSDWKESGRGLSIFEMSELLDFSDEENEPEPEENSEEEEEEDPSSSDQSNWSEDSGHNPWQIAEEEDAQAGEEATPSIARRSLADPSSESDQDDDDDEEDQDSFHEPESVRVSRRASAHHVRIHASRTEGNAYINSAMSTGWSGGNRGMPLNPPMIHALATSKSGQFVAAGLASSSVEIFIGSGKHLVHNESFYGHSRGVSALHMLQDDQFLVSGGNDSCLFVWPLASDESAGAPEDLSGGTQVRHSRKIEAITGSELARIYVTDSRPIITMMDLSLC